MIWHGRFSVQNICHLVVFKISFRFSLSLFVSNWNESTNGAQPRLHRYWSAPHSRAPRCSHRELFTLNRVYLSSNASSQKELITKFMNKKKQQQQQQNTKWKYNEPAAWERISKFSSQSDRGGLTTSASKRAFRAIVNTATSWEFGRQSVLLFII